MNWILAILIGQLSRTRSQASEDNAVSGHARAERKAEHE